MSYVHPNTKEPTLQADASSDVDTHARLDLQIQNSSSSFTARAENQSASLDHMTSSYCDLSHPQVISTPTILSTRFEQE